MSDTDPFEIQFPPVHPKNLIRLGEDLLHASSIPALAPMRYVVTNEDRQYLSSISELISRDASFPTYLPPAEAAALAEIFRNAVSILRSRPRYYPALNLWLRLYAHALLRESRIFPGVELRDETPDCVQNGFADIWKGDYGGRPVCVKVIRTQDWISLREIEKIYHRVGEGSEIEHHPNVLPVIEISETLFPLCIMNPWMPNGNITQYTQANPDANRLVLLAQVCHALMHLHGSGILHGNITPNNILIAQNGQACVGEFGITGAFRSLAFDAYEIGTLRYTAPERFPLKALEGLTAGGPSKERDVYSLMMTSFSVLTGVLPYHGHNHSAIHRDITGGVRPFRPTVPSENRWLHDPVWNVIMAGWRHRPGRRCELPVAYHVFLTSSRMGPQDGKSGPQQRRANLLPRIASFFQFLRDSESEIQRRVNEMDKLLEDHTVPDPERLKLFNKLCKTCSQHHVVPKSMDIPDCSEGSVEVESGGFANVSRSTYEGRRVAVKIVRVYVTSDLDLILSRFCREAVSWKHLRHPNILPLLGVTVSEHQFALVSEWMENGNINDFIERYRHVNRVELLANVANGLKYMHDLRMVHGDLKGANILINEDWRACIADFGLSTITGVATHAVAGASEASLMSTDTLMSFTGGGTRRWMSPELLHPERFGMPESEDNRPTGQSDCYALGMVIYEVLCGHHPYIEFQSDILAVNAVLEGVRPGKPERAKRLGFSDELWKIVELCWLEDRNARPNVADILSCLNDAIPSWYRREI